MKYVSPSFWFDKESKNLGKLQSPAVIDIIHQEVTASELQQAAEQHAGSDLSGEPVESVLLPPVVPEV